MFRSSDARLTRWTSRPSLVVLASVMAYRNGNGLVKLKAFPAMRPNLFFEGPVTDAVRSEPSFFTLFREYNEYVLRRLAVGFDI